MVKNALEFDFIKTALVVVAAFGVQLIEPFFIATKSKTKSHSELQVLFTDMQSGLQFNDLDESFFAFEYACIRGVTDEVLLSVVANEYGTSVVEALKATVVQRINPAVALANKMKLKLDEVLERQLGERYEFGKKAESDRSVFKQVKNVDKTITQNIEMERMCGVADNRLKKKIRLATVSRDIILHKTRGMQNWEDEEFRKMGPVVA